MSSPLAKGTQAGPKTGWGITTGKPGHEQQVLGVLERLVDEPKLIRVNPTGIAKWLAPWAPPKFDPQVTAPWPDIVVTAGRQSAPYARMIGKRSKGQTFTAVLQDPKAPPSWFDFLWVNTHDKAKGDNVFKTFTAPHRVTQNRLAEDATTLRANSGLPPAPFIGMLLGGPSAAFPFSLEEAQTLGRAAAKLAEQRGASLIITPSRRTGKDGLQAIVEGLGTTPHWIWDGTGENPYFGILGLADEIIATCDSVNMLGEACFTGKPVHMAKLKGGTDKFIRFHRELLKTDAAKWLDEFNAPWAYEPLDAMSDIVSEIIHRYEEKKARLAGS